MQLEFIIFSYSYKKMCLIFSYYFECASPVLRLVDSFIYDLQYCFVRQQKNNVDIFTKHDKEIFSHLDFVFSNCTKNNQNQITPQIKSVIFSACFLCLCQQKKLLLQNHHSKMFGLESFDCSCYQFCVIIKFTVKQTKDKRCHKILVHSTNAHLDAFYCLILLFSRFCLAICFLILVRIENSVLNKN